MEQARQDEARRRRGEMCDAVFRREMGECGTRKKEGSGVVGARGFETVFGDSIDFRLGGGATPDCVMCS